MEVIHKTPFVAEATRIIDVEGSFAVLTILKATFTVGTGGIVTVAEEQRPIIVADEWLGEIGHSTTLHESDGAYYKPGTDIVATGQVVAPGGKPVPECLAHLRVGTVRKAVRVFGDRRWVVSALGTSWTPPLAFERMPICWERAFGGFDLSISPPRAGQWEPRNPVGPGFCSRGNYAALDGVLLPNFERPGSEISSCRDRPAPQGFSFVGRGWEPRVQYAGKYDEHWRQTRMPVLPENFDVRFFNGAPADLQYPGHLVGGECVDAVNLSTRGTDRFTLPRLQVEFEGVGFGRTVRVRAALDTVVFTLSEDRFTMVWRAKFKIRHNEPEEPVLAHVSNC